MSSRAIVEEFWRLMATNDFFPVARAISFFTVSDGRIEKLVEHWPDPYPAPANRAHLVEPM